MDQDHDPIGFRPVSRTDFPLLSDWFSRPHVEPWWREPYDEASVETRYGPSVDGEDATELFIVEHSGTPVGFIQWYFIDDNQVWKADLARAVDGTNCAGIDYLIGDPDLIGRGMGPRLIDRFVADRWCRHPHVQAVIVDIDQQNRRSWRAVEKAGFRRVWAGKLESNDPSDAGDSFIYTRTVRDRLSPDVGRP